MAIDAELKRQDQAAVLQPWLLVTDATSPTGLADPVADALARTRLTSILSTLQGTLAAVVSGTIALDSATITSLKSVTAAVSGAVSITGAVAVTGTFWQATQPVSGTFWQTTQPVSGPATDAQLRATPLPVTGPLTDTQVRAAPLPVSGTFFQATQPISVAALPLPTGAATQATLAAILAAFPPITLSSRMATRSPQTGYRIWLDTANASFIYVAEAPTAETAGTGTVFNGTRVPKDANGNPLGKVEELTGFAWTSRTTAVGWA